MLNVSGVAPTALDYLFVKTDQPLTVQMGAADAVLVNSIMVKDGTLAAGITSITFRNPGATAANLTFAALGH